MEIKKIEKTQLVRIFDVFILAPAMIYVGATNKKLPMWLRGFILVSGIGTGVYNGINYLRQIQPAGSPDLTGVYYRPRNGNEGEY